MALLTKKDFAASVDMQTKKLSVYIQRGKVIAEDNGLIDTNNPTNKSFLIIHSSKADHSASAKPAKEKQIPRDETWVDPSFDEDEPEDPNGIPPLHISEARYKHARAKKTEASEELERLKIEKLKGDVIPTAPIEVLVFQFKQYTLTQQKITYEAFLSEIGHKYSINSTDMAYYRSFFIKGLNSAVASATDKFIMDLGSTLATYSVKK